MVQCEMCGAETTSPHTVKIEGAELEVCEDCADFGTEIRQSTEENTSSKYSTGGSSSDTDSAGSASTASSSSDTSTRRHDMFDDMETVATDYDDRIREAREATGMSQEELASELNEKASLIRKLESGSILPSDAVQEELENELDISLLENASADDGEWESAGESGGYTLGDVVRRKD